MYSRKSKTQKNSLALLTGEATEHLRFLSCPLLLTQATDCRSNGSIPSALTFTTTCAHQKLPRYAQFPASMPGADTSREQG